MAINYPGPYEVRIKYTPANLTNPVLEHIQRLNVDLVAPADQGQPFSQYNIKDKNGATSVTLEAAVEAYLAVHNALHHTATTINSVELWKYPTPQSFDSVFWATHTPAANVGTSGTIPSSAGQAIYTFRTTEGGIMKLSLMEAIRVPGSPLAYAACTANEKALIDFILDGNGTTFSAPFLGRDTSYPLAFNRLFPGQNEATWKKRNGR